MIADDYLDNMENKQLGLDALQDRECQKAGAMRSAPRVKLQMSDFIVDRSIGEGSFSTVVRAAFRASNEIIALKIMRKKLIFSEQKVSNVKRERHILDKLHHPSIVKLLFTFQDEHCLYLGMELVAGGEILDQIRLRQGFDQEMTRFYAAEMVESLEYLKSQSIVHRDFKPENILLCGDGHIKLIDFGSAKDMGAEDCDDESSRDSPKSYSFVGTAEYISPEVLSSMPTGYAADYWALGCIIYQMQANSPPFKGATEYLTFQLIQEREFTFPSTFSEQVRNLIDDLLTLDPDNRLGSRARGLEEVKSHPFFKSTPWGHLWDQEAPPRLAVPSEDDQPEDSILPESSFDPF